MKRLAIVMVFVLLTFCFAFTSEAGVWNANYPNSPDDSTVYDRFSWDGYSHAIVTWNDSVYTASQVLMDPDGRPWLYYWADFYAYGLDVWYSYDGYYWYYYGFLYY